MKNAARSLAGRAALEKILFDQTNSHARNEITQSLLCRQVFAPKFTKIFLHGSWNGAIRWLVIFYEIFYEKSIFFLRKKQIQKWQCNTLDLHIFLPKFPEFPAGGPNLFFRQTFVAVATSTENGRCTGKYDRPRHHVIFFTTYVILQRMTSPLP